MLEASSFSGHNYCAWQIGAVVNAVDINQAAVVVSEWMGLDD